jgi:hypothetical protein
VNGTSYTPTPHLPNAQNYEWWVRADVNNGLAGPWSNSSTFSIGRPGTPTPIGPFGTTVNAMPTFSWAGDGSAATYDLWVDDNTAHISQVLRNQSIPGSSSSVTPTTPFIPGHTYVWWIRELGSDGNPSAWSPATTFTLAPLQTPVNIGLTTNAGTSQLLSSLPILGEVFADVFAGGPPLLNWATVQGADYYDVWIDDLTTGQSQIMRSKQVQGTSVSLGFTLQPGQIYEVWIRAYDNSGDFSAWSGNIFVA